MARRPATIFGLVKITCAFCDKAMNPLQYEKHKSQCYERAVAQAKGETK